MRKLLFGVVALAFSQFSYAVPIISGAIDVASDDGETYYGLVARDGSYFIEGYSAAGASTGYSVSLTPNEYVTTGQQDFVGLAYDGSAFFVLRNDATSSLVQTDSWTIAGFDMDGTYNGFAVELGPQPWVAPSQQSYVGLDHAQGQFFALRDDSAIADDWTYIGFDMEGNWNGFAQALGESPADVPYIGLAAYANSPLQLQPTTNVAKASVPEPGTGLLLSTLLLGLLGRRKLKRA